MSTDDSISEDVSSSAALSHCHVGADGEKESETSLVSSEGTSPSGLAISEERHTTSQTTGGTVESRPMDITPACDKIRSLGLSTDEAFEQEKNLPFINPSSFETLRVLVQEIQNSGETDPEIWKDCEDRWLHLFQLVEKQYQEQILAQQEQYQCQIQLIQDEIKALVQLQNRQTSVHPQTEFTPTPVTKTTTNTKDYIFPIIPSDCTVFKNVRDNDNDSLAAPVYTPISSPSPPPARSGTNNQGEERAITVLSSGYGTLSAWETGLEPAESPGSMDKDWDDGQEREKHQWVNNLQEDTETTVGGYQQDFSSERTIGVDEAKPTINQQKASGSSQQLTSWAQRQKLKPKKNKTGPASAQIPEYQEQSRSLRESNQRTLLDNTDSHDQHGAPGLLSSSLPLRRSDSLMSEASGLTYWRLNECDLYRQLPDSFDSGAFLLLQEASMSLSPSQEPKVSLREIYQNKQKDFKGTDWEESVASSPSSQQVMTLDPAANMQQSDRTSGFTSPSHFSSPSFPAQVHLYPRARTSLTPDSMVEATGNTDCISDTSSVSVARHLTTKLQTSWTAQALLSTSREKPQLSHSTSQQNRISAPIGSEEEGSHTHTSTLKPCSASGASVLPAGSPHMERSSSLEDPVILSLLRQNLREKHSRHIADLKAYYESEIQNLRDKLKLKDLPQDLEESNRALTERCQDLEKALADTTSRIQELETTNTLLEKKLTEWPERYAVAGATVKSLQQRLEESKRSCKEKDALAARLKTRIWQLEEVAQKVCREADEKEARREREYKMMQDLLSEHNSLMKEHEVLKNNLMSAQSKLVDANDHISELKRVISKLESQVKQLEHENQARIRYTSHNSTQPSGAGLFHHPDLILSPSKNKTEPDVTRRRSPCSLTDQMNGGRKSPFPRTNQSSVHKRSSYSLSDCSTGTGSSVDASSLGGNWRCASPPECEQTMPQVRLPEKSAVQKEASQREGSSPLTPMMRALIELEETKATESRAPWVSQQRTTVGFVEQKHKELIHKRGEHLQTKKDVKPGGDMVGPENDGLKSLNDVERGTSLLRAQRSLSPEGHRSASLPPSALRNIPTATPTKREMLLTPLSAKSSPKRCPTENYSTAFGHPMPREQYLLHRLDGQVDKRRHSFHSSSPRKRLQFTPTHKDDIREPESSGCVKPLDGTPQLGWEQQKNCSVPDRQDASEDLLLLSSDRPQSLSEAERLFDELTQEKMQIEAALSRMPAAGGRVSLQTRLDEVALEKRLESLNRELGSLRMTLKRFHVLRSSANT